jgi:hypothetical protein
MSLHHSCRYSVSVRNHNQHGARWQIVSLLTTAIQFPVYALIFTAVKRTRWQLIAGLGLLLAHGLAFAFAARYHYHVV